MYLSFTETIAFQLSMAGMTPRISFDTVPNDVSSDISKRPCHKYHLRFGGTKLRGIQALYTDGTYRSVASPNPNPPQTRTTKRAKRVKKTKRSRRFESFMTYEVYDASFIVIGQYGRGRKGLTLEELIFTNRDWVDVDALVPVLRGLYSRRVSATKLEATIAEMYEIAAMRQKLYDEGRIPNS